MGKRTLTKVEYLYFLIKGQIKLELDAPRVFFTEESRDHTRKILQTTKKVTVITQLCTNKSKGRKYSYLKRDYSIRCDQE